jgi:hypothetical protein
MDRYLIVLRGAGGELDRRTAAAGNVSNENTTD